MLHMTAAEARRAGLTPKKPHRHSATPLPVHPLANEPLASQSGRWTLIIPQYNPATLNALTRGTWRARIRLAEYDKDIIGWYARDQHIPKAEKKRRVGAIISRPGRLCDVDAFFKST